MKKEEWELSESKIDKTDDVFLPITHDYDPLQERYNDIKYWFDKKNDVKDFISQMESMDGWTVLLDEHPELEKALRDADASFRILEMVVGNINDAYGEI